MATEIEAWCRAATAGESADDPEAPFKLMLVINELRQRVATYNIPYLALEATTPKDVALDVFVKMNTSYVKLTPFDIIVAQFEGVTGESLHDLVAQLTSEAPAVPRYIEPSDLVLEIAALRADRPPTQASYLALDLSRLAEEWEKIVAGAAFAVQFLEDERIFDRDRLPTIAVIRILAALHEHLGPLDELGNARRLLRKFLWRAFFTARYEAAASTASLQDFRALRDVLSGSASENDVPLFNEEDYPLPGPAELKQAGWPKGSDSLARAILDVTIRAGAHDLADDGVATREQIVKREYHHLFPASLLEKEAQLSQREVYRELNCALITWNTNRNIAAKEPIRYLRERVERANLGEDEIRRRLATHYIPYDALNVGNYAEIADPDTRRKKLKDDYERFLDERAQLLLEPMAALCSGQIPPAPHTDPAPTATSAN